MNFVVIIWLIIGIIISIFVARKFLKAFDGGGGGCLVWICLLIICGCLWIGGAMSGEDMSFGSSSSTVTARCGSCGRTFSDSSNNKSIRRTNMCTNCYRNYDYVN